MVNNGTITAPIKMSEVSYLIGENSKDLGTLCKSQKINMWAKYKPVGNSSFDYSSQMNSDKTWMESATWWKGSDGKCGLVIPQSTASGVPEASNMKDWASHYSEYEYSYNPPTGGTSQPFRLVDFNCYDHNAEPPTKYGDVPDKVTDNGTIANPRFTYTFGVSFNHNSNWVQLHDITLADGNGGYVDLSNWYLGAIFVSKDKSKAFLGTSSTKIDDTLNICLCEVHTNDTTFYTTEWTMYPLIASVSTNGSLVNTGYSGKIISMPTIESSIILASKFSDKYSLEINYANLNQNVLTINYNATAPDNASSFNGTFTLFACSYYGQPYNPQNMLSFDRTVQVGENNTATNSNISSTTLSNLGYGQTGGEYLRVYFHTEIGGQEIESDEAVVTVS